MTPKKLPENCPGDTHEAMQRHAFNTGMLDHELINAIADDPAALAASTAAAKKARPGKFDSTDVESQLRDIAEDLARPEPKCPCEDDADA